MAKKKDIRNAYLLEINSSTESFAEETMLPITYNNVQEECLAARKNLFWHPTFGFDNKSAGVYGTMSAQEEEQRLLDYTHGQVRFTFVSHRFVYFQIAGSDKYYHITAPYKHGNVLTENAEDTVKNNPYLKIADKLYIAERERKEIASNYLSISARDVFSSVRVSESDFISMDDSDVTEMATTLFKEIHEIGLDNLFYAPTRAYINNKIKECFPTEFMSISIQLNENHLLSAKISTIYDESRRERLAKKDKTEKDVADGSSYLTNLKNFIGYVKSAHKHYVKEYNYAHKQSKTANSKILKNNIMNTNNSNINTMSENKANNNSSVNFIVKSIMSLFNKESEVYKYAELGGFNINTIVENSTSGMVSVSVNTETVVMTSKHGYSITVPIQDFQDEMAREDIEYGINRILQREEKFLSASHTDVTTKTGEEPIVINAPAAEDAATNNSTLPKDAKKQYNASVKKKLTTLTEKVAKAESLQAKKSVIYWEMQRTAKDTGLLTLMTDHSYHSLVSFLNKRNESEITKLAA